MNTDTPLPQEEPAGKNPPDGAIINYYLKSPASGPVVLEIFDSSNKLVRRFSSDDKPESLEVIEKQVNIPVYWIRPSQQLSTGVGMQRFVWDLHYDPLDWVPPQFPIAAIYGDTPRHPLGPWVSPGSYRIELTANGRRYTQSLTVKMDPRVKTSPADLAQQHEIAMKCYEGLLQVRNAQMQSRRLREQIKNLRERAVPAPLAEALSALDGRLAAIDGAGGPRGGGGRPTGADPTFSRMNGELTTLMASVEGADVKPTTQTISVSEDVLKRLTELISRWSQTRDRDVNSLNEQLRAASLPELTPGR
jgi:hypothetical protein